MDLKDATPEDISRELARRARGEQFSFVLSFYFAGEKPGVAASMGGSPKGITSALVEVLERLESKEYMEVVNLPGKN